MKIGLVSNQAASAVPSDFGRHVQDLALQLRLLGHDCFVVGFAARRSVRGEVQHVSGTRLRLVQAPSGSDEDHLPTVDAMLEEEQPDVVWLLQLPGAQETAAAARRRGIGVVSDLHGLTCALDAAFTRACIPGEKHGEPLLWEWSHPHSPDGIRHALALSDAVVVHAESERQAAVLSGVSGERIHNVPLGIRYAAGAGKTHDRSSDVLTLGFAGPLSRQFGLHVLLDALALRPDLPVRMLVRVSGKGDAGYESSVKERATDDPRIEFPVPEARALLPDLLGDVDVLVVPAIIPDVCPMLPLEAIAARKPVIVTEVSGVGEIVRLHRCGSVVEPGSASALAHALDRFVGGDALTRIRVGMGHPPGIEEEALGLERVAREAVAIAPRPRVDAPPSESGGARLVGGGIDYPYHQSEVARTALLIAGWALCAPYAVSRIEVSINGEPLGRARLGLARPLLSESFASPEAGACGFEHWVDLTALPDDLTEARFEVAVEAVDGSRFSLWPVDVAVMDPVVADDETRARVRILDERLARHDPPKRPAGGSPEVRLAAFGHDLGLGGGQLYLYELLRRLAAEPWLSCTVVATRDGPLRKDFEALGMPVHVSAPSVMNDLESFEGKQAELAAWMRQEGFNAVLANTLLAFPGVDLAARLGLPSVWAVHESYDLSVFWAVHNPHVAVDPIINERITGAFASASAVVFEADATRKMFDRYGDPRRFVKVDYGIDTAEIREYTERVSRSEVRARLGIPESAVVLLMLGTIEPRKSQTVLAQAFAQTAPHHPEAYLVLVGDSGSDYAAELRRYLRAAGLEERSRVVKVLKDTYQWYRAADVFVCPSDLESLPRSVLEVMAFGVPVAATGAFGLKELIDDGSTGWLCDTRDLGQLRDLLDRVLSLTQGEREAVARAGERLVAERHDSRLYAASYGRMLRALVRDPKVLPHDALRETPATPQVEHPAAPRRRTVGARQDPMVPQPATAVTRNPRQPRTRDLPGRT